jgi:iron complex outermembrane recepter protein
MRAKEIHQQRLVKNYGSLLFFIAAMLITVCQTPRAQDQAPEQEDPLATEELEEDQPEPGPKTGQTAQLEEMVVTSQKREQNLQVVPAAVSAYSADTIENASIYNIEDVSTMTPGFTVSTYNPVTPQPYIRGVGTNSSSVGDDSSVGVFIDEVYAGRAGGYRADLFDVERVEVLRGPQGTLYGRNVSGGAMNIITRNPTEILESYFEAGYGEFDLYSFKGAISGPLGDSDLLKGRLAFSTRQRDGHTTNVITGNDLRNEDNISIRTKLAIDPLNDVSILLGGEYSKDNLQGPAARGFRGVADPTSDQADVVSLLQDGFTDREMFGLSAIIDVDWGPGTLTSITAFRHNDYQFLDDLRGTSGGALINEADELSDQFTQELRYTASQNQWDYTLGLYYFSEEVDRVEVWDSSARFGTAGSSRAVWDGSNETTSLAAFAESTYHFSERVNVTVGGRYTWDEKDFKSVAMPVDQIGFLLETYSVEEDESWSEFTPKATLQFQATDDVMLYGSWSNGFKSGGFNGLAANRSAAVTPFEPETVTSYELGMKADLLDKRLRLNASAFFMDYVDLQNFFIATGTNQVVTATADAEMKGVEVEVFATPLEGLDINLSYGWLDTEYTKFESNSAIVGNQLMRAPETKVAAGIQYTLPIRDFGSAMLRGDFSYRTETFLDVQNTPIGAAPAYSLFNARLAVRHNSGWEFSLWGKNLGDKEYIVHAFDRGGAGFSVYGDPLMWGMNVSYYY